MTNDMVSLDAQAAVGGPNGPAAGRFVLTGHAASCRLAVMNYQAAVMRPSIVADV
jgi:hypothetical protein